MNFRATIKSILPKPIWYFLRHLRNAALNFYDYIIWLKNKKQTPPPHNIKQQQIKKAKDLFKCSILVETGTYYGDMIFAMQKHFKEIYSIELSTNLYNLAQERFKKHKHIKLLNGDSGKLLKDVVKELKEPALFWLDGHYSGGITAQGEKDTPIFEELSHIFNSKLKHIILIDDARCFGRNQDYPTIEELKTFVSQNKSDAVINVEYDIIKIT